MTEQSDKNTRDSITAGAEQVPAKHIVLKLSLLAVGMFAFSFWVMPPLYTLLCEVTGLRKVGGAYTPVESTVDTERFVTVQFVATHNDKMPWAFKPRVHKMKVNPGQAITTAFLAKNETTRQMVAQAVPSITPFNAVNYFHKTECFCFEQQPLAGGESAELGLQFIVDQELPKHVRTITLSYTLFDITDATQEELLDDPHKKAEVDKRQTTHKNQKQTTLVSLLP